MEGDLYRVPELQVISSIGGTTISPKMFERKKAALMLVYDITNLESFEVLLNYI